jgi:hypothetical protein
VFARAETDTSLWLWASGRDLPCLASSKSIGNRFVREALNRGLQRRLTEGTKSRGQTVWVRVLRIRELGVRKGGVVRGPQKSLQESDPRCLSR